MSKPVICEDGIHCGECPNLRDYDDSATCSLTGNELSWHDFWIAECDIVDVTTRPMEDNHA